MWIEWGKLTNQRPNERCVCTTQFSPHEQCAKRYDERVSLCVSNCMYITEANAHSKPYSVYARLSMSYYIRELRATLISWF